MERGIFSYFEQAVSDFNVRLDAYTANSFSDTIAAFSNLADVCLIMAHYPGGDHRKSILRTAGINWLDLSKERDDFMHRTWALSVVTEYFEKLQILVA